ncbi:MAG: hypothetical protein JSV82_10010 [Planctomycetota bacterium]|nr:MAG: hypothetical protein JSV82_10010 [Planctomycetota bacterium]
MKRLYYPKSQVIIGGFGLVLLFAFTGRVQLFGQEIQKQDNVKMEKVSYAGWPNCIMLTNGQVELIATTDVGPRIVRFGYVGGQNLFKEYKDQMGKTGGNQWRIYGGHRLWHCPEDHKRTYYPDNSKITYEWDGKSLKLSQPVETTTGIAKEIEVTLDARSSRVKVLHRLINHNQWDIESSPWALTAMAPTGRIILPQEPYRPHPDYLLAARPLVLWHFTDMSDPRWTWGEKYIQLRQDLTAKTKEKVGLLNKQGWGAYYLNGQLFVKRYPYNPDATYPDYGCNTETFTDGDMLEFETLGPLAKIPAKGGKVEHVEVWYLFKAELGEGESEIDKKVLPLIKKTSCS